MSNINNHVVGMNKINLAADVQELTCEEAAAIHGGAKIILYTGKNFKGKSFVITANERSGRRLQLKKPYNNEISSAKVISGVWTLDTSKTPRLSRSIVVDRGQYSFTGGFNDTISLVRRGNR